MECGPNNYVVASFVATGVCDENDELLAILASQVQITTPENDLSDLFTIETYSVFEDSATLMADVASTLDCITADKRRVLYVVGDRSRPQTPLVDRAGFARRRYTGSVCPRIRTPMCLGNFPLIRFVHGASTPRPTNFAGFGLQEAYITRPWYVLDAAKGRVTTFCITMFSLGCSRDAPLFRSALGTAVRNEKVVVTIEVLAHLTGLTAVDK